MSDVRSVKVRARFEKLDRAIGEPYKAYDREVTLTVEQRPESSNYGAVLAMIGGPTGYESFYVADRLRGLGGNNHDWCACAGTPGTWDRCTVPASEMVRAFRELGIEPTLPEEVTP